MKWNNDQDEALCKQILLIEPFQYRARTIRSGSAWSKIAIEFNQMTSLHFDRLLDNRAVRDRFNTIKDNFKGKVRAEEIASGISPPELTPTENAIEDIIEREKEAECMFCIEDAENSKSVEKQIQTGEEMRLQSLETFAETRKQNTANDEGGDVEPTKAKKKRRTGTDTLIYLQEKTEKEIELKKEELALKKEEQEEHFAGQKDMRQQQNQIYQGFSKMQETMQSQMQKQVELQQQQMQQNNQLMMMMMQMMQNSKKG
ncbi:LOW QUALITY PROTEIN: uncharacterized protein DDB_G0285291-like [Actinia tenebrosa]|uniref:LOW QUALITY PROTEIN: uncharacterized protein DDB_G0285291-like n=1 Tax=Actinia tenebrosa TaxID=6105 RepID=A0A6P8ITH6_ACTTE|nr:LOW QUALITY PROTEIN: uncharacterized protein DDB_G0285291-like [Actinia tenebrosa]